jgi:glutathione S-transferase
MALRLYDYELSGSCYKVRLLLSFLEIPHERVPIDFYPGREHKRPDFLALNPLGQIPVLDDDGVVLRDAQAILCHLADTHDRNGTWLPRSSPFFGQTMMWLMFGGGEIMNASAARLHDMLGYRLDIDAARRNARDAFRLLDDHLTQREFDGGEWIVGKTPTIADIACFPYVALSRDGGIGHEEYPAIQRWLRRFRRLPKFVVMPGIPVFL